MFTKYLNSADVIIIMFKFLFLVIGQNYNNSNYSNNSNKLNYNSRNHFTVVINTKINQWYYEFSVFEINNCLLFME